MSMGHTYKFFGFYISYTIFTLPLSIFHLSSMLLILCTFPPLSPSQSPIDNPPCDLHLYGSVPVLVVCLVCSCFFLGVVVNNCEFAVIETHNFGVPDDALTNWTTWPGPYHYSFKLKIHGHKTTMRISQEYMHSKHTGIIA